MSPRAAWKPATFRWELRPAFGEADDLARQLRTSPLVAQLLANRGACSIEQARAFLEPKLSDLPEPHLLGGAEKAAGILLEAARAKTPIVFYGDYDVDGITGVSILHTCLRMLDADVRYYVPHRLDEGYGVNSRAVAALARDGARLLVTVDCGISAHKPLAEARQAGMEVIVTDHHTPPAELPPAAAIVHPALPGSDYPNPSLAGCGVAFKLAWQIAKMASGATRVTEPLRNFLLDATVLAALGTIADVVPLVGENRVLATWGLRGLPASKHVGLRALLECSGLLKEAVDAYHVGFVLAPRLNACGRMGHAGLAVELLTDAEPKRALEIAEYLNQQNALRQKVEREIADHAADMVRTCRQDDPDCRAIVLASDQWHGGVVGIVASRIVEQFNRPAVLIAVNGDGTAQGSARSVPGFNMHSALDACSQHLLSYGGHAMAGGLRVRAEHIAEFTCAFQQWARTAVPDESLQPALELDAETTLPALSFPAVTQIRRLAPFGQGNPPPLVSIRGCQLLAPARRMGQRGRAVSMILAQDGARMRAVGFGMGDLADSLAGVSRVDVAGEPVINNFNGNSSVELHLRDVRW